MAHSWDTDDDDDRSTSEYSAFDWEQISISALKIFAWIDLIGGIVFSIIFYKAMSGSASRIDITVLAISLAIFLQGIFIWALFLVISSIAENLIAIRRNTLPPKIPSP